MTSAPSGQVSRYLPAQRLIHWVGVGSFLLLLLSGLALLFPPLAFLAAGGLSRLLHRLAVAPFILLPVAYALFLPKQAKELLTESFTYTRDDLEWFKHMPAYVLGRTKGLPPQGRINAGQKIHHASTFLMFVTVAASGFVLWFGVGQLGPDGHALTAMVHDLSVLGLSVLMIGHVYFTFLYEALSGMVTGFVSEQYARMEHLKWFEALSAPAAVGAAASNNGGGAGRVESGRPAETPPEAPPTDGNAGSAEGG